MYLVWLITEKPYLFIHQFQQTELNDMSINFNRRSLLPHTNSGINICNFSLRWTSAMCCFYQPTTFGFCCHLLWEKVSVRWFHKIALFLLSESLKDHSAFAFALRKISFSLLKI